MFGRWGFFYLLRFDTWQWNYVYILSAFQKYNTVWEKRYCNTSKKVYILANIWVIFYVYGSLLIYTTNTKVKMRQFFLSKISCFSLNSIQHVLNFEVLVEAWTDLALYWTTLPPTESFNESDGSTREGSCWRQLVGLAANRAQYAKDKTQM